MNFEFYRGETFSRYITLEGYIEDVDAAYFTIKSNQDNKDYCLQKTLGNGLLITEKDDAGTTINLTIDADDTDGLKCNAKYYYDLKIVSGQVKKEVLNGTIILKNNITLCCNEV